MQWKQLFYGYYLYFMQIDILPPTLKAMRSNRTGRTKRKNRRKAVFSLIYKGFSAFERECFSGEKLSFSGFRTVSHRLDIRQIFVSPS